MSGKGPPSSRLKGMWAGMRAVSWLERKREMSAPGAWVTDPFPTCFAGLSAHKTFHSYISGRRIISSSIWYIGA